MVLVEDNWFGVIKNNCLGVFCYKRHEFDERINTFPSPSKYLVYDYSFRYIDLPLSMLTFKNILFFNSTEEAELFVFQNPTFKNTIKPKLFKLIYSKWVSGFEDNLFWLYVFEEDVSINLEIIMKLSFKSAKLIKICYNDCWSRYEQMGQKIFNIG